MTIRFSVRVLDTHSPASHVQEAAAVIAESRVSEERARELFDAADADKSGSIDYEEFKHVRTANIPRLMSPMEDPVVCLLAAACGDAME